MKVLEEFLDLLETRSVPEAVSARAAAADATYTAFLDHRRAGRTRIYGTDTLPGHRDRDVHGADDPSRYQYELVAKHCIAGGPFLDRRQTAAVTLAKAYSAFPGGPILSGDLVRDILRAFEDPHFDPQVPAHASYSAGDVIPAAHWAVALMAWRSGAPASQLGEGEGMGLINGAFVHAGVTASLCGRLAAFWPRYLKVLRLILSTIEADPRALVLPPGTVRAPMDAALAYVAQDLRPHSAPVQAPVSVRTTRQVLDSFAVMARSLATACDDALQTPTGNPLFFDDPAGKASPSGTFLDTTLTCATSGLVDSLLLTAWASVQRMTYVLSGRCGDFPVDGSGEDDPIGLIQWPKNAQAKLERLRHACGMRAFASGASTSYGIEDLWSYGTETALTAEHALDEVETILSMELYCVLSASRAGGLALPGGEAFSDMEFPKFADEALARGMLSHLERAYRDQPVPSLWKDG